MVFSNVSICTYEVYSESLNQVSVSTYVEQGDTREVVDIKVLNAEIEQIVAR